MTLPLVVEMTVDTGNSYELSAETNQHEINLDNELEINVIGHDVPEYEGSYTVDAGLSAVVLNTQDKRLTQNVTVNALTENSISSHTLTINQSTGKVSTSVQVTPGYNDATLYSNKNLNLSTEAGKTVTPTTSEQYAVYSHTYTLGDIKVGAIPTGTAGTPTATKGTVTNHSISVTPSVTNTTGYITGSTINGTAVSVSASELVSGNKAITSNGNNIDVANYSTVSVNVPTVTPTGEIPITQNGTYDVTNYASADVNVSGGNPHAERNDVNFLDYDGSVLYSYTARDFANLSALPSNPTHSGLTAQGWNWTLADAKTLVASAGGIDIGQNYVTDDNKTRLYISVFNPELPVDIRLATTSGNSALIDWGDGNTTTVTSTNASTTSTHTYGSPGYYCIKLSGSLHFDGGANNYCILGLKTREQYCRRLIKVELGNHWTVLPRSLFVMCRGLETVTIPSTITSIEGDVFYECNTLKCVVISKNTTTVSANSIARNTVGIPVTLPKSVTTLGEQVYNYWNNSITRAIFPPNITTIPKLACGYNYALQSVYMPDTLTTIGNTVFYMCSSLTKLTIPSAVSSIGSEAFFKCTSMTEYHIKPTTPPTLANTNAFSNIPSGCVIYVPRSENQAVLNAYKTAQNWSTYASYMQEEPQ